MRWPWRRAEIKAQKEAIAHSEARRELIESQWDFIREQVRVARRHKRQNHITELIMGVAKGKP